MSTTELGMVLGQTEAGETLVWRGDAHCAVIGPNGSGKGVNNVVTTLRYLAQCSVVALDIKNALWPLTAGTRAEHGVVCKFDPTGDTGVRINPLLEVRQGLNEVRDMQQIADILSSPSGAERQEHPHWLGRTRALLVATGLHVLYAEPVTEKSIGGMLRFLSRQRPDAEMWTAMLTTHHLGTRVHPAVARAAWSMLHPTDKREPEGVLQTAKRMLSLWEDPLLDCATSTSDIALADLQYGTQPMTLYLSIPASDLSRLAPVVRMIWQLILRRLTEQIPPPTAWPLRLILDEFASMGSVEFFETIFPYLREYKILAMIVLQSLKQLDHWYSMTTSILENCDAKVLVGAGDERTAERIVKWLGEQTITENRAGWTKRRLSWWPETTNASAQDTGRALLTTDEVMHLVPNEEALVFVRGLRPILAQQICSYRDPQWTARQRPVPLSKRFGLSSTPPSPWLREGVKRPVVAGKGKRTR